MKQVAYTKTALKSLRRIPVNEAEKITTKIAQYAADPAAQANNVTKLVGRPALRLRVGDWRIIFEEDEATISVLAVGPRGGVYG